MLSIRPATAADFDTIWQIFAAIIAAGDTYVNDNTFTRDQAYQMWFGPTVATFAICDGDDVIGAYKLLPNMPGRGAHVANGSYIVGAAYRGQGVGRLLVADSIKQAKQLGYKAIQFNMVVSTNHGAIKLYETFGFRILATIPKAFRHDQLGYIDAHVMHRSLEDEPDERAELD